MPDHTSFPAVALHSAAMLVTPAMAEHWLVANTDNRPIRRFTVLEYAGAMKRGEWKLSPQGVTFSASGRLLDGQHRLAAIVQAGVNVWLYVTRGAPDDVFSVLDQGARRSYADVSGLPKKVAEARGFLARQMWQGKTHPTVAQINVVPHAIDQVAIDLLAEAGTTRRGVASAPSIAAAALRAMRDGHRGWVFATYKAMVNLDFSSLDPAPLSFLRQCIDSRAGTKLDMFARAWTTFDYAGRARTKIQIRDASNAWVEAHDFLKSMPVEGRA